MNKEANILKLTALGLAITVISSVFMSPVIAQDRKEKPKTRRSLTQAIAAFTNESFGTDSDCGVFALTVDCDPDPPKSGPACGPGSGLGSCNPVTKTGF